MKTKILLQIISLLFISKLNAQFNKQWLLSGGGQVSYYEQTTKTLYNNGRINNDKGVQTNIGVSAEFGYFILNNLSLSYQLTYLLYDDKKINSGHNIYTFIRNGISLNKLIPLNKDLFLNFGTTPFYTKRSFKESTLPEFKEDIHGCIFDSGVTFLIEGNSLLSISLYKQLDNFSETAYYNDKSGILIKYKYILTKKKQLNENNKSYKIA